jgi:hypothetical protein
MTETSYFSVMLITEETSTREIIRLATSNPIVAAQL